MLTVFWQRLSRQVCVTLNSKHIHWKGEALCEGFPEANRYLASGAEEEASLRQTTMISLPDTLPPLGVPLQSLFLFLLPLSIVYLFFCCLPVSLSSLALTRSIAVAMTASATGLAARDHGVKSPSIPVLSVSELFIEKVIKDLVDRGQTAAKNTWMDGRTDRWTDGWTVLWTEECNT